MQKRFMVRIISVVAAFVIFIGGMPAMAASTPLPDTAEARTVEYGSTTEVTANARTLRFVPEVTGIYSLKISAEDPMYTQQIAIYQGDTLISDHECAWMSDCSIRLNAGTTYYFVGYVPAGAAGSRTFSITLSWGCLPTIGKGSNKITGDSETIEARFRVGDYHVLGVELTPELCPSPRYSWEDQSQMISSEETMADNFAYGHSPIFCYITYGEETRYCRFMISYDDCFSFISDDTEDIMVMEGDRVERTVEFTYDAPEGFAGSLGYDYMIYYGGGGSGHVSSYPGFDITADPDDHPVHCVGIERNYDNVTVQNSASFYIYVLEEGVSYVRLRQNNTVHIDNDSDQGFDRFIYRFIPAQTGYYKLDISNFEIGDPHVAVFDSEYNFVGRCATDNYVSLNRMNHADVHLESEVLLQANETYYIAIPVCAQTSREKYDFSISYSGEEQTVLPGQGENELPIIPADTIGDEPEQPADQPQQQPSDNPGGNGGSSGNGSSNAGNGGSSSTTTPAPSTPTTPTATPAIPTPAPSQETSSEPGVSGFVERLYTVALGRNSDPVGKQDWIDAITMRGETGASAARGFLYSPEFLNKNCTTEEFVAVLYRTFFNREPDQAGFNAWVGVLNNGTSKEEVIEGFINSTEWANLCLFYGIRSGGTGTPSIEVEPNQGTIDFATRLYTTCLNRSADQGGLMAWARQLANQRDTGTGAARGFFFSSEFTNQNVSNEEYVNRLYRTFMGREADEAGFTAWVAQLNEGVSREAVFNGFAESPEFTRICASYGIVR